ncbi:Gfo/Idh/MocA family protein [Gimesia aquarii]|uniref:Inositol 2-dehydrogenase n=1 Tax=Gimesia aquarii TaxID=2527964 RepID=A0A517VRJ7_9PLAN|nr:Gfo/Idh/MocA family oxidoreductase [Gimesia aquarii]QDT95655.1 Inositol 2-dehydrogenase [Gimesia aquarii]
MSNSVDRREFLKKALIAGTAVPALTTSLPFAAAENETKKKGPNEKLNLATIGVAARAYSNIKGTKSENFVALCDIDSKRLEKAAQEFPHADTYDDYRKVFDRNDLDAVLVSTPDHMHAPAVAAALRKGLPVYCEKPLTHSVYEARVLTDLAAKAGVATQMGNQIHATDNYRTVVETVQSGVIGPVRRVHVWLGGGVRIEGKRAKENHPPAHVNYDQWIGPAPFRPYDPSHFHFNWRYWWDFGNGQLGDFGCHYMDLPFWALKLKYPKTVVAVGQKGHAGENDCPSQMRVDYEFGAREDLPPVHMTWYHGGWKPKGAEVYEKGSAVLFEGDDGRLLADYGTNKLFMEAGKDANPVKPFLTRPKSHHIEWLDAIRNGTPTGSNFGYAGPLTETVLLGNVSYRVGQKKLEWDAKNLKVTNVPEAAQYVKREYRKGWTL